MVTIIASSALGGLEFSECTCRRPILPKRSEPLAMWPERLTRKGVAVLGSVQLGSSPTAVKNDVSPI